MKRISSYIVLFGIISLLFSGFLLLQKNTPQRLSVDLTSLDRHVNTNGRYPLLVTIQSIDISLPVLPAQVNNGVWETTSKGISYLTESAIPGDVGNSVFYGHNWKSILGDLSDIKINDQITIRMNDDTNLSYRVTEIFVTSPTDSSILKNTDTKTITIYTCTGFLDTKRLVVKAEISD